MVQGAGSMTVRVPVCWVLTRAFFLSWRWSPPCFVCTWPFLGEHVRERESTKGVFKKRKNEIIYCVLQGTGDR